MDEGYGFFAIRSPLHGRWPLRAAAVCVAMAPAGMTDPGSVLSVYVSPTVSFIRIFCTFMIAYRGCICTYTYYTNRTHAFLLSSPLFTSICTYTIMLLRKGSGLSAPDRSDFLSKILYTENKTGENLTYLLWGHVSHTCRGRGRVSDRPFRQYPPASEYAGRFIDKRILKEQKEKHYGPEHTDKPDHKSTDR